MEDDNSPRTKAQIIAAMNDRVNDWDEPVEFIVNTVFSLAGEPETMTPVEFIGPFFEALQINRKRMLGELN